MMNLSEELSRLHDLIKSLEEQNRVLKGQLDNLHRTYGCECKPNTPLVVDTEGCQ